MDSNTSISVRRVARSRNSNTRSRSRVQRVRQGAGVIGVDAPLAPVPWNRLEMSVFREHGGSGFRTPPGQPRIPVGGIADQCEVIGDRGRRHAKFRNDRCFVEHDSRAAIELHDTCPANRLREVLVRRADVDALGTGVERLPRAAAAASASSASNSIMGQTLTPAATSTSSSRGNCAAKSPGIPSPVLYPGQSRLRNDSMT